MRGGQDDGTGKIIREAEVASEPAAQLMRMRWFCPVHVHISLQQPATVLGKVVAYRAGFSMPSPINQLKKHIMVDMFAS